MIEYHVYTLTNFQDNVDESGNKIKFGGWLNIRMNLAERTFIYLGKYEAIFKQYISTKKLWTYKGKCWIVPKEEGYGIMILDFQSQGFGFGYPLTVPYLQTINEYFALHPKYIDTDAAINILGYTHK